jgi:hypothetical protein
MHQERGQQHISSWFVLTQIMVIVIFMTVVALLFLEFYVAVQWARKKHAFHGVKRGLSGRLPRKILALRHR